MINEKKATATIQTAENAINKNVGAERNELEKLKAQNEEFEKELIRAREMRMEMQKIEADKLLAGTAGGRIEPQPVKEETPKEYADRVMNNQIIAKKRDDKG